MRREAAEVEYSVRLRCAQAQSKARRCVQVEAHLYVFHGLGCGSSVELLANTLGCSTAMFLCGTSTELFDRNNASEMQTISLCDTPP